VTLYHYVLLSFGASSIVSYSQPPLLILIRNPKSQIIIRFFSNRDLAENYNTLDALLGDERVYKFGKWASTQTGRGNLRMKWPVNGCENGMTIDEMREYDIDMRLRVMIREASDIECDILLPHYVFFADTMHQKCWAITVNPTSGDCDISLCRVDFVLHQSSISWSCVNFRLHFRPLLNTVRYRYTINFRILCQLSCLSRIWLEASTTGGIYYRQYSVMVCCLSYAL
jgi:hypothetical protein